MAEIVTPQIIDLDRIAFQGGIFMITRQLLSISVLAIGALVTLGCGSQRQVTSNVTQAPNQISNKIDPVGDARNVAAMPGSSLVGDVASYSTLGRAAQFVLPNPRQHVFSSGFPGHDY
jgi:hypothetical protein